MKCNPLHGLFLHLACNQENSFSAKFKNNSNMNKYILLLSLLSVMASAAVAKSPQNISRITDAKQQEERWQCHTALHAEGRKSKVENSIMPHVVFDGKIKANSIQSEMRKLKLPAFSVAVIHNGQLDWSDAWGQLEANGTPVDCGSLFQAGSLAKPATVLAALRLKAAKKIDFDKNIENYLASYELPAGQQNKTHPVTFRNLLTHTSGLTAGGYGGYAQKVQLPSDQQIVRGEAPSNTSKVSVENEPGTSLVYSGGGYTVVEIALQDHLNQDFNQIMNQWLLRPIGMKQADFSVPLAKSKHLYTARGHQIDGTVVPGGWHNHPEQAAAGLWATATDMAMLLIEMHKGFKGESEVFTKASILELISKPIENHAFGFRMMGQGDDVFITHYGGTMGYQAGMTLNLRTGDGAVYLSNANHGSNLGAAFLRAVSRTYDWSVFKEENVQRLKLPSKILKSLTGTYTFPDQGWQMHVTLENGDLRFEFPDGNRLPLVMTAIQGRPLEFAHETGVHAYFKDKESIMHIQLFGQIGQRLETSPSEK